MPEFSDDAVRRIRATVKASESSPAGVPSQFQPKPNLSPIEFRLGKCDEAITATTNQLSSGSIGSGTVSLYRWNATNSAWEDTGDDVEAYDFLGVGYAYNEYVHLHRHPFQDGVLWCLAKKPKAEYLSSIACGTSTTLTRNTWVTANLVDNGGSGAGTTSSVFQVSSNTLLLRDAMKPASGANATFMVTVEFTFLMNVNAATLFVDLRGRLSGWGFYGGQHVDGGTPITWVDYNPGVLRTTTYQKTITGICECQVGSPFTAACTPELFFNEDATNVSGTAYCNIQAHAIRQDSE